MMCLKVVVRCWCWLSRARCCWLLAGDAYLPSLHRQKLLWCFPSWALEKERTPRWQKWGWADSAAVQGQGNNGWATAATRVWVLQGEFVGLRENQSWRNLFGAHLLNTAKPTRNIGRSHAVNSSSAAWKRFSSPLDIRSTTVQWLNSFCPPPHKEILQFEPGKK